jgi:hypothetical protein
MMALVRQITREPVPTGARFIDTNQVCGVGLPLAEWINVGLPGADGAEGDDLSAVVFDDRGNRVRVFVDIHTDVQRARLVHG